MKSSRTESFDAIIDGRECQIEFTRVTTFVHDAHYGADADGNRGMPMDFIDEDIAEDVCISFIEDDGPMPVPKHLEAEVEKAVDAYIESHEAEAPEPEEPDYDNRDD